MVRKIPAIFFASLCFFNALSATIVKPWTVEFNTGYREDTFNWRIQDKGDLSTGLISEKYSDVRFWSNRLRFYTVYRDLYFSGSFEYGIFGRGDLLQNSVANSVTSADPSFTFTTTGYNFLAKVTAGYQCNLTPMRYYRVILTPLFGYSLTYEKLNRVAQNTHYDTSTIDVDSALGEPLTMHWSGPFLGVNLSMNPSGGFTLEIGYAYNWLYVHQTLFSEIRVKNYSTAGALLVDRNIIQKGKIKTGGALGQTGHVRLHYQISPHWAVGALGLIDYRSSAVEAVNITTQIENIFPVGGPVEYVISRNYKSRWTSVSALAEVDYTF